MMTAISEFKTAPDFIEKLAKQNWVVLDSALSNADAQSLLSYAKAQFIEGNFHSAQMGRGSERHLNSQDRGDSTLWLNHEDSPSLFSNFDKLRLQLNEGLYLGLQDFECHWAHYPAGTRYEKHLDQARGSQPLLGERVITFVLYLNQNWMPGDGGELLLHLPSSKPLITPVMGRMILFLSDSIRHEVLLSNKERWSLTGWFRRRRL